MRNSIKKNNIKNTKLYKKGVSVLLALSLSLNAVSFDVFHGLFGESLTTKVSAAYTVHNDDKDRFDEIGTAFANNDTGKENFLDFCYFYQTDDDFAAKYVNATVSVNFITFPSEFTGFGNRTVKFRGDFRIQDTGNADVYLPCALFTHVYDSAKITNAEGQPMTLKVVKTSDQSSPLLAECVYHDTAEAANSSTWNITASSNNENPYAGIIGEMKEDAKLTLEYANSSAADIISNSDGTNITADVGSICGKMESGAELTASILGLSNVEISSSHGNAGGFVGSMEGNSKLTITSLPSGFAPVVTASSTGEGKGYAGGMIGSMTSSASLDMTALNTDVLTIDGTISGTNGAGGYCGYYVNSAENAVLDLSKYNITATVSGSSSGGVFGVLENQSVLYTVTGGGTGEIAPKIESKCSAGNYGGVIGTYKTTALANTLHLKNMNTYAQATDSLTIFGGAIGKVDSVAYIRTDNVKVTATDSDKGWFGGLVGETSAERGVFIDLADFTLDATGFTGGGVIGKFHNGILHLSGITDMTSAKVGGTWTTTAKYGQLVGENNNVLVYAVGDGTNGTSAEFDSETGEISTAASGWTFKRSTNSIADDIGTWGEVVRIADAETDILTLDSSAHTVTLKAAQTTMDSAEDLVLTALNIQLNQGSGYDCLLFADTTTSNRDTLLASSLTISDSLSFSGTGVNGFMRDGSDSIGAFTGTLTGGTVTLATGETYGVYSNGQIEGLGQIYRHPYNGLFSVMGSNAEVNNEKPTATVNTLTVDGDINIRNAGMSEMYAGGIVAKVNGNVTLNSITASQKVNYHEGANISSSETKGKSIGGLIGCVSNDANGSTIAVTGTNIINTAFTLSGRHQSWNILGSFIGKVTSPAFTINIAQNTGDTLTDKHKTDISGITTQGANADGGGLIGYITRNGTYSNRKINIDNLIFDDCTVGNVATTNGGGLLGYAWLETDTTIGGTNGITVTNATITNSTPANVGAMCYQATGK